MDDGRPAAVCADLAAAIGQLFDIRLDLASWANREGASVEQIEPMTRAVDGAVRELRLVMPLLLQLEQLPDVWLVGALFPSLDALAEHARHVDPLIPDGILLRLQQVIFTTRGALAAVKPSSDLHPSSGTSGCAD